LMEKEESLFLDQFIILEAHLRLLINIILHHYNNFFFLSYVIINFNKLILLDVA
jgi:hypothetical protein